MPLDETIVAGQAGHITDHQTIAVAVNALGSGTEVWTAWTPALTASTTNPTMGSGAVATGRYSQNGKTVTGWGHIKFGTSGAAAGSGLYMVSLPVAPKTHATSTVAVGNGNLVDAGTTATTANFMLWSGESVLHFQPVTNASTVSNTVPW